MDNQRAIQLLQAHIDAEDMPLFSQAAAMGIRALERVAALEAELADARKDGERLSEAEKGQYSIRYNVMNERWEINTCELHPAHRRYVAMKTLRAAIDAARAAEGGKG